MTWALLPIGLLAIALIATLMLLLRAARAAARLERTAREGQVERLRELEKLAARNAAILQNAMDGFFVLGEDYGFLEVNDAFCGMTGYSSEELLRMKMTDLEVSAPAQDGDSAAYWRTGLHHFATSHRHKDGHVIQLESCVIVLRDGSAKILVGFARDVTERCRAERALRKSEAQYRNLVETSRDLIWSLDLEGRWTFVNNAAKAIYGYEPEEMLGRPLMEFVRPENHQRVRQVLAELRAGKPRLGYETEHIRKDGSTVYLSVNVIPVRDDYGNLIGSTGTATDISYRKQAEERLRQAQKLESLGVLAGGVAHDFNNLLVGIMGNASLAIEKLPANSALRPLLERVVSAGRRATDLTQRMLAYAGRATCDVQIMDLNGLVQEMAEFAAAAVPKNVSLHIKPQPELPLIKADSGQVQQVIMNLFINAAEATGDDGGDVTVSTWEEELDADRIAADFADQTLTAGRYVCLEVRDTGSGMPPEVLSRIFDPFFTTKFAGRGLGLSAILGIVRAHQGAVTVSSEVGVGTVFRVLFPAAAAKAGVPVRQTKGDGLPRGSTVLVIDDEEDIRDVVEAVLGSRGINVLTAADGREGLEVFKQHVDAVDAVLLDMNMPGMSGEAVFEALLAEKPGVKVILSTGYSEQEAAAHFAAAPLAGFVHKPYTASALVDKIGTALAMS